MSQARSTFYRTCCLALLLWCARPSFAEPLHDWIDAFIDAKAGGPMAPPAGDAEFLRRVYLDVVGDVPTSAELRAFLADAAADKRVRVIDRLLADPRYARRMQDVVNVMLMERRE